MFGLISDNDKKAYLEEVKSLESWCHGKNLLMNICKTKDLIVDFSMKQERRYHPLNISGTPVETLWRTVVSNLVFTHVGDTWSCHSNTLVKKAQQCLY